MSLLSIKNLSIEFGGVKALSDVSLELRTNTFVGLMGPNGAGKTTLINCLSRIFNPSKGTIFFEGKDLLKLAGDELQTIGIARTFQDLNFFNQLSDTSVIDYVKLGQFNPNRLRLFQDSMQVKKSRFYEHELTENARKILDFFRQARNFMEPSEMERGYPILYGRTGFPNLQDVENYPIGSLSFAWRRRLDLARALFSKPKLLLLDEPAQGLPPSEIENLGKLLKIIKAEFGISALIVEHDVAALMEISDEIIVMNHGEVLAQGTPENISNNQETIDIYLGNIDSSLSSSDVYKKQQISKNIDRKTSAPLLSVKNLSLQYGSAQALASVSMSVFSKEIVAILGTNGSGKSSLLRAISGIEAPSYGEIFFKGHPLPIGWPEVVVDAGIQYVPQGHLIFPSLSVLENLKIGSFVIKKGGLKFKDALDKVFKYFPSLKDVLSIQAASLSGGQQQMLAIGQAIMGTPEILMLDEPSLGLAPKLVETLFEIIKKISYEEKCAIILVEQNVRKALAISDYIIMLSSGSVIGEGTSAQLGENDETLKRYLGFN